MTNQMVVAENEPVQNPEKHSADRSGWASSSNGAEFDYQPVPTSAPIAFGISLLGLVTFIAPLGATFGIVAIGLGLLSMRKIAQSDGAYSGYWVAVGSVVLAIVCSGSGLAYQAYEYAHELPEGYQRVNFVRDVSDKEFVIRDGLRELHPDVAVLKEKKIFIKGYMYQTQRMTGLRSFVLLKDNGECCFGGDPKPFDMMRVELVGGETVDSIDGIVSVGGLLQAKPEARPGDPVYILKADFVEKARTSF